MYGPPPDPAQVIVAVPWGAWAASLAVAVVAGVLAWRSRGGARLAWSALAGVAGLTAPMIGMVPVAVIGSYPTIDKAGSLHFFRAGTHWRLLDAHDAGVQLIGVHLGHLWVVEAFARVMPDWAAFNAQSVLNLWLAWVCTAVWLDHRTGRRSPGAAFLLAMPFALGLHQFRDINWYTVEKTSIFVLPLWLWCVDRRRSGAAAAVGALAMFLNVYMGILIAAMGAWRALGAALGRRGSELLPVVATAAGMLPFAIWQAVLMRGAHAPGSPDAFLHQRAALDVVTLWPWTWNRLEGWRATNLLVLALAGVGAVAGLRSARRARTAWALLGAALALVVALGPEGNPIYMALFDAVPGFWRVAKPETFFFLPYLACVTAAAEALPPLVARQRTLLALTLVGGWLWGVRAHPVYPDFYARPPAPEHP